MSLTIHRSVELPRALAYGEACFETFLVVDGRIPLWTGHVRRLRVGLQAFGYRLDPGMADELHAYCTSLVADGAYRVRLLIGGGDAGWGMFSPAAGLAAHVQLMPLSGDNSPLHLESANYPFALRPKPAKFVADYAELLRAVRLVRKREVLWLAQGQVLGGLTANCWLYRQGTWWTPPCMPGVLPGVARACLLAARVGREAPCPSAWLRDCEAIALTNAVRGVMPVSSIDGRMLPADHAAMDVLFSAWKEAIA